MMTVATLKALQIYGIAIAISAIVALLIKAMVWITARLENMKPAEVPLGTVCPIGPGVPEEDVAALSAAIFAMVGPHHILHITQTSHRWASGARAAQHSHTTGPR